MMVDMIVINYNLFDANSTIQIIKNNNTRKKNVPSIITTLVNEAIKLAYEENIFEIGINAPEDIVDEISNRINDTNILVYSI